MSEVEKAVEILKYYEAQPYFFSKDMPALLAFRLSISALEKQIPRMPTEIKIIEFVGSQSPIFKIGNCPCCGNYVDTDDYINFCTNQNCGQALKWD